MLWPRIGYAALCVVVPAAWGLLIFWASSRIEKRVLRDQIKYDASEPPTLPLDYHI